MVKNEERLMQYIMYLSAAILELFMFSFSGNLLIDEASILIITYYSIKAVRSSITK